MAEYRFTEMTKMDEMARVLGGKFDSKNLDAAYHIGLDKNHMEEVAKVCDRYNGYSISSSSTEDELLKDGEDVDKEKLVSEYDSHKSSKLRREAIYDVTVEAGKQRLITPDDPEWKDVSDRNDKVLTSIAYITEIKNRKAYNAKDLKDQLKHEISDYKEDAEEDAAQIAVDNMKTASGRKITGDDIIAYMFLQMLPVVNKTYRRVASSATFGKKWIVDNLGDGIVRSDKNQDASWSAFVNLAWNLFRFGNKVIKGIHGNVFGSSNVRYQNTSIEDAIKKAENSEHTLVEIMQRRLNGQFTNLFGLDYSEYAKDENGNDIVDEHGKKQLIGTVGHRRGAGLQAQNAIEGRNSYKGDTSRITRGFKTLNDDEGNTTSELDLIGDKSIEVGNVDDMDFEDFVDSAMPTVIKCISDSSVLWDDRGYDAELVKKTFPDYKVGDYTQNFVSNNAIVLDHAPAAKLLYTIIRCPGEVASKAAFRMSAISSKPVNQKYKDGTVGLLKKDRGPNVIKKLSQFKAETTGKFENLDFETIGLEPINDCLTFIARIIVSTTFKKSESFRNFLCNRINNIYKTKFGEPIQIYEGEVDGKVPQAYPQSWDVDEAGMLITNKHKAIKNTRTINAAKALAEINDEKASEMNESLIQSIFEEISRIS